MTNSKPNRDKMWYAKCCFCFSHWVFNVYCILKCFLLLLIVKCYLFSCSLVLSLSCSCFCSPAHKHKQTMLMMMITVRLVTPRVRARVCVCAVCSSDFNLVRQSVAVAVASYSQIKSVTHICQFICILCWSDSVFTTVPNAGFKRIRISYPTVSIDI